MKRRSFLRSSIVGTAALGLPVSAWPASLSWPENVADWLLHWQNMLGLRTARIPEAARSAIDAAQAGFLERGYEARRNRVLVAPDTAGDRFFYPLELRRVRAGLLDLSLLAFHRRPDGSWHHTLTMNSFHLEALCRALPALDGHETPAAALLLPTGAWQQLSFPTRAGSVETTVQLGAHGATVTATVRQGSQTVWTEQFSSRHTLRCG